MKPVPKQSSHAASQQQRRAVGERAPDHQARPDEAFTSRATDADRATAGSHLSVAPSTSQPGPASGPQPAKLRRPRVSRWQSEPPGQHAEANNAAEMMGRDRGVVGTGLMAQVEGRSRSSSQEAPLDLAAGMDQGDGRPVKATAAPAEVKA